MRVVEFQSAAVHEFRFLNAGRGPGAFYEDRLPVHVARVDQLPEGMTALIATADLQGRERFEDSLDGSIRLLGEALPERLVNEVLPALNLGENERIGALLAGDFYTVPALDRRGGDGDVTKVWRAFAEQFAWVVGVPGNHDTFGESRPRRPKFPAPIRFLDGDATEVNGLRIAGLGGIIGKSTRPNRRSEDDYLATLLQLLQFRPDIVLMHEGPDGAAAGQRGLSRVRELLQRAKVGLVIRGHAHWDDPFAEFPTGLQIVNVDARVVVFKS